MIVVYVKADLSESEHKALKKWAIDMDMTVEQAAAEMIQRGLDTIDD